jgi:hypothetical protein
MYAHNGWYHLHASHVRCVFSSAGVNQWIIRIK